MRWKGKSHPHNGKVQDETSSGVEAATSYLEDLTKAINEGG